MLELDDAMREILGITRMEELWGLKAPALYLKVGTGDIYADTGACCLPYAKTFTGLQDIAKRYGFAYRQENTKCGMCSAQTEYLLARTVSGTWVSWFGIRKPGEFNGYRRCAHSARYANIIRVADCLDVMFAGRSYQKPKTKEQMEEDLRKNAGKSMAKPAVDAALRAYFIPAARA